MEINEALYIFRWEIAEVNKIVDFAYSKDTNGDDICDESLQNFIVSNSFLKLFIAWEGFLESSYISFLLGNQSILGTQLTRYANPINEEHAHKILIGTQKYVDWSNPDIIKKIANLYFLDGDPFQTVISSIQNDLFDMKTIRNAAAHISTTTQKNLDSLASRKLERPGMILNALVSTFLTSVLPHTSPAQTVLEYYISIIEAAADAISQG